MLQSEIFTSELAECRLFKPIAVIPSSHHAIAGWVAFFWILWFAARKCLAIATN